MKRMHKRSRKTEICIKNRRLRVCTVTA